VGVLLSIALAAVLWLLNALSKSYETALTVNLTWVNASQDQVVVNKLPDVAQLRVQASGWKLLFESLQTRTLRLDPAAFGNRKLIVAQDHLSVFAGALPRGMHLVSLQPDSILLETEPGKRKKVPLLLRAELDFAPFCGTTAPAQLEPDSVWISGPASVIDPLFFWATEPVVAQNVSESLQGNAALEQSRRVNIRLEQSKVGYRVPVDRFTEMSLDVPLTTLPQPGVSMIPDQVTVSFQVPMQRYESIRKEDFRLDIDWQDAGDSSHHLVDVRMIRHPKGLQHIHWHPKSVELIVRHHD
jgi:hypothetical protein